MKIRRYSGTDGSQRSRRSAKRLTLLLVLSASLGFVLALILAVAGFAALQAGAWRFWRNSASIDWFEVVRASVTLLAAAGVGAGAALAYRRQILGEEQLELAHLQRSDELNRDDRDHRLNLVARRRDRFAASSSQLADDGLAVRIAGAYSLAALADEWIQQDPDVKDALTSQSLREAQVCVDVLCAYMRTDSKLPRQGVAESAEDSTQPWDIEVRQTIVRLISERLSSPRSTWSSRDTAEPGPWSAFDLDFTGATFCGDFDFGSLTPTGKITFRNAKFTAGKVTFTQANFKDGSIYFANAEFCGADVSWRRCNFATRFGFHNARFSAGAAFFDECTFTAGSDDIGSGFAGSTLDGGYVVFDDIEVPEGAVLDLATFKLNSGRLFFQLWFNAKSRIDGLVDMSFSRFSGGAFEVGYNLRDRGSAGYFSFSNSFCSDEEFAPKLPGVPKGTIPDTWPPKKSPGDGA